MGSYFSQEEERSVYSGVEVDHVVHTPEVPTYSKLFTLATDPRSPDISRTPMVVPESFADPRSPGNDSVDRTLLDDDVSSPIVRFKLDNEGFESSPTVNEIGNKFIQDTGFCDESSSVSNDGYQHSPAVLCNEDPSSVPDDGIEDINEDYDYEIIGEKPEDFSKATCLELGNRETKSLQTRNQLKKRFNATQKSILKTVLFKPYEELNDDHLNVLNGNSTHLQNPLGLRKDNMNNGDIDCPKTLLYSNKSSGEDILSTKNKFPLREISHSDKENVVG